METPDALSIIPAALTLDWVPGIGCSPGTFSVSSQKGADVPLNVVQRALDLDRTVFLFASVAGTSNCQPSRLKEWSYAFATRRGVKIFPAGSAFPARINQKVLKR